MRTARVAGVRAEVDQRGIAEYRRMLEEGNPAELFEAKGEDLWKKPRGPKNASLQACDLGLGPGVVKGAWVQLPRFFADTGRVQDVESRLVTCMSTLQGFDAAQLVATPFGRGEMANITALATWIASESRGMRFALPQGHPEERRMYELGKRAFFFRGGPMTGSRGITQLRWATFGEPSQVNSQPHLDSDGDLVGAHNGNVVNNVELRLQFMKEGMIVRSMNDGESCVHAVERYLNKGYDFIDAIRLAYGDLDGDYAFVIGRVNDDRLYAFKKGSGLVVGLGDDFSCVSSDLPSILPLTRKLVRMNDGVIVTLWAERVELRSVKDGSVISRNPETITETMDVVQKGGYLLFMLKEIHEQSQVAREVLHMLDGSPDVESVIQKMKAARHLYFIGCGTS